MPVSTLVETAGAANANAYVSLAVANQFHLDRPTPGDTTWSAATDPEKTAAILWATKLMDAMWEWYGSVTDYVQALLWPRSGLSKRNGDALPNNIIPVELQHATAEFARQLLAGDRAADNDVETQKITDLTAGPISLSFGANVAAKVVPDAVVNLIPRDWGYVRGRSGLTRPVARA